MPSSASSTLVPRFLSHPETDRERPGFPVHRRRLMLPRPYPDRIGSIYCDILSEICQKRRVEAGPPRRLNNTAGPDNSIAPVPGHFGCNHPVTRALAPNLRPLMTGNPSIVFLFPSYQPTEIFCGLLEQFRLGDQSPIVVVDDGSGPTYAPLFQRLKQISGTTLLANAINLGKGAALKHGMNHILVNYPDCVGVVTADADGQHSVTDILRVAAELKQQPNRVVFGARQFSSSVPLRSRFGNTVSRYVYRLLIGVRLADTQTGLRGVPGGLWSFASAFVPTGTNSRRSSSWSSSRPACRPRSSDRDDLYR